jgi:hypothetical protein
MVSTLARLVLIVIALLISAPVCAQAVCATCNATKTGAPGADACSVWVVNWTRTSNGNCTLNPAPHCAATNNCLFTVTISIIDTCGANYASQLCMSFVNQLGQPVGGELCGPVQPVPDPTTPMIIADYPVACGQKHSLKFFRVGDALPFLTVSAICSGCPS